MKRVIRNTSIVASSFNRAISHMNKYQCMFITAFRGEYSKNVNVKRNKQLFDDIKKSNLSFIKANGGYIENYGTEDAKNVTEDTYMIINNNKYTSNDFITLAIAWCKKYDQDAVLVTTPEFEDNKFISVSAKYYDKNGNIDMEFSDANMHTVEEYFTEICGKSFVLSTCDIEECIYANNRNLHSHIGVMSASTDFRRIYPKYNVKNIKANYVRSAVNYVLEWVDRVPLEHVEDEHDESRDYEPSFWYNNQRYYIDDFAPYDVFETDVSNYWDMFGVESYPMILNDGSRESYERPFIIDIDGDRVNIIEEKEI